MKILIVGSGGREHAIVWKIAQSPLAKTIYCAPGNPGTAEFAENTDISDSDIEKLAEFAKAEKVDLTIVGPEVPLSLGIVDRFQEEDLKIFGPNQELAQIESSKAYAKKVMQAAGVPTAAYEEFNNLADLSEYIKNNPGPIVLKADGLAAGKGVFVCQESSEAEDAARKLFQDFDADIVIAEELLSGVEASFIVATDGKRIVPLATSHDYKRIGDQDQGLNTGGMGTVSPTPRLADFSTEQIVDEIIKPVVNELNKSGQKYCGFLYAGLMISESGELNVLEFNARLGDPETQVIMRRLDGDFLEIISALCKESSLPEIKWTNDTALCVVKASAGYPQSSSSGDIISGISQANQKEDIAVFHAGTKLKDNHIVTAGGRVLNITGLGKDLDDAISKTYAACELISFEGEQMRTDIGR